MKSELRAATKKTQAPGQMGSVNTHLDYSSLWDPQLSLSQDWADKQHGCSPQPWSNPS